MAKRNPVSQEALAKAEGGMKYDDEKEYDSDGKVMKGGGYRMSKGKLVKMGSYEKSENLDTDDLQKSLDRLVAFAEEGDAPTRKDALLAKAATSDLEKSEREELFNLLGGETVPNHAGLGTELVKSMEENETLKEAYDVSDFLAEHSSELTKSLRTLGDHLEKSDHRQHEFNLVLAKAVADVGNLVKSVATTVDAMASQPVRAPKSRGVNPGTRVLEKSFGGETPQEERLTKSDMLQGLEGLMHETMEKSGSLNYNGVNLLTEISKFEQSGHMHPAVAEVVKNRVQGQRAAH